MSYHTKEKKEMINKYTSNGSKSGYKNILTSGLQTRVKPILVSESQIQKQRQQNKSQVTSNLNPERQYSQHANVESSKSVQNSKTQSITKDTFFFLEFVANYLQKYIFNYAKNDKKNQNHVNVIFNQYELKNVFEIMTQMKQNGLDYLQMKINYFIGKVQEGNWQISEKMRMGMGMENNYFYMIDFEIYNLVNSV